MAVGYQWAWRFSDADRPGRDKLHLYWALPGLVFLTFDGGDIYDMEYQTGYPMDITRRQPWTSAEMGDRLGLYEMLSDEEGLYERDKVEAGWENPKREESVLKWSRYLKSEMRFFYKEKFDSADEALEVLKFVTAAWSCGLRELEAEEPTHWAKCRRVMEEVPNMGYEG